jgi:hypothetical protein
MDEGEGEMNLGAWRCDGGEGRMNGWKEDWRG